MRTRSERGAALVEFALVAPILIMLALGIVEFGFRYAKTAQLNNYAFIGARDVAVRDMVSASTIQKSRDATDPDAVPVVATPCPTVPTGSDNAVVTITATINSPTRFFPPGGTFTVNARGEARCDG